MQDQFHTYGIIALSTMKLFRTDHILLCKDTPLTSCLCDCCENCDQNLKALRGVGFRNLPSNKYDAVNMSMCDIRVPQNGSDFTFAPVECVYGQCPNCGVNKLEKIIRESNTDILGEQRAMTWRKWMKPKNKSAPHNMHIRGTTEQALKDLLEIVSTLSAHLFRANWN